MKRRTSGLILSLLMLVSLTACGTDQGFVPETSNDTIWAVVPDGSSAPESSRPPEDGSQEGNFPDGSQLWDNSGSVEGNRPDGKSSEGNSTVDEDGWYSSKEEVALYIHLYGDLPDNYVTKDEAEDAGWSGGNVERYTGEGTAIGGSRFGNREGLLPKEQGRTYTECDIDTVGENSRGAKRIVFSNDGLVYYTDDHYESFELLYGEP